MRRLLIIAVLAAAVALVACEPKPVAVVNDEKISRKMLDEYVAEKIQRHAGMTVDESSIKKAALEQLIAERLMIQGAAELNISVSDKEVSALLGQMQRSVGEEAFLNDLRRRGQSIQDLSRKTRERIVISRLIETLVPDTAVSEDEIREYYKNSPTPFFKPAQVQVRFIETRTEEGARGILEDVRERGGDFDAVADELRKKNTQGGMITVSNYGWANPNFFPPETSEALKSTEKGAHGGPYRGKAGFYLFRVKDRKEKSIKSFEEARAEVKAKLLDEKRQVAIGHWVFEKRKLSRVRINNS